MKKAIFTLLTVLFLTIISYGQERPNVIYPLFTNGVELESKSASNVNTPFMPIEAAPAVYQNGADRLVTIQNNDGGWDWSVADDGDPNNASPVNTLGPIAMGLAQAYHFTGDPAHSAALSNAGALLLTKTNNFSPSDGYLAAMLDKIFGGTAYVNHVTTNFYAPLAAGTYDRNGAGTNYTTASYVDLIRTSRASGGIGNLAAWDIGMGLVGAAMAGANTTDWVAGVKAEIDELDGAESYDVIGLAGAIYGLAIVAEDYDPTAGEHAAASSLADLANILASYQIDMGGFAWNSAYVIANDANETIQETAYALLALNEVDRALYLPNIEGAGNYLVSVQLLTGGWENYSTSGENNEITAEALWGISVSSPELFVDAVTGNDANLGSKASPLATIQAAITGIPAAGQINVAAGTYEFTSQMDIDKDISIIGQGAVTIKANNPSWSTVNGEKHLIGIYAGTQISPVTISNITMDCNNQCFGVNTYNNAFGILNDVAINKGNGPGLTVNGSTIIATDLNTSNNAWGAVNVDPGSGVTDPTVFTLNSGNLGEDNQIWSDRSYVTGTATVTVNAPPDYSEYVLGDGAHTGTHFWTNRALTNFATINGGTTVYSSIQNAIDAASSGDVIDVAAGAYNENVLVTKLLTITGNTVDPSTVIIDGGQNDHVVTLAANGVTFEGFQVQNSGLTDTDGGGIVIYNVSGCFIQDNIVTDCVAGIAFQAASSNTVQRNLLQVNLGYGIYVGTDVAPSTNNTISQNEVTTSGVEGIYGDVGNNTNTYDGNNIHNNTGIGLHLWKAQTSIITNNIVNNNGGVGIRLRGSSNNTISGNTISNENIGLLVLSGALDGKDNTITDNEITSNDIGIQIEDDVSGNNYIGEVTGNTINNNQISANLSFGVKAVDVPGSLVIDATNNWWGDASGPSGFGPGTGDAVSDYVSFDPWIGKAETQTASGAVPLTINFPTSGVDITFNTLPVGGGTVTVQRYNEAPSGYPAPPAGATNAGLWLDITSSMPNYSFNADVTVDVTGLGFDASTSIMYFNSTTNTWVVVNNGAYAAGTPETYTFTTNHFTPFSFINTPATAYNIYLASSDTATASSVIYPNDAWGNTLYEGDDWDFTAPIDLYIVPEEGSIFGASDIVLQWDNTLFSYAGVDESGGLYHTLGVQVLYNQLGTTDQVTINATRLDNNNFTTVSGDYICKLQLNLLKPGFGPINFTSMDFRAFDGGTGQEGVYVVGNGAAVKSYLGDVITAGDESTGDGEVGFEDLTLWTGSYWSGVTGYTGPNNYKVKYDVGPTADNTVYSLPTVDGEIQFEDMVIFAISYGLSADNIYPKTAPAPETPVELHVGEPIYVGNETLVQLSLKGTVVDVRALELSFGGSFGKLVSVEKGALLQNVEAPVVIMDKSSNNIANVDLAIFGADVEGLNAEGEILTLRFEGRADIQMSSANVRNSGNNSMKIEISNSNISAIPTSFALDQNYPNPFNPSTIISFQLPEQRHVSIAIFNMLGEEVSTLVNEVKEAGYHKVEWSGTNLTSGVYFYRIEAGDFVSVKKMMLMK